MVVSSPPALAPDPVTALAARPLRRLSMLLALCGGAFLATGSSIGITPFLLAIGLELNVDLGTAASLVALQSVSWGITSLFAGAASDRLGRRPLLVGGLIGMGLTSFGMSLSTDFLWLAVWRVLGGIGGGAYTSTVFATVADQFPAAERGRSLGWVVTGQSLALVLGVPAMTLLGNALGWRGALQATAGIVVVWALALLVIVPRGGEPVGGPPPSLGRMLRVIQPPTLALLLANSTERVCYAAVAVYLPAYLLTRYSVDAAELAVGLGLVACGNLVGNQIGGRLSDRLPVPHLLLAGALAGAGVLALPMLTWAPAVAISVALGFVYTLVNSIGRPTVLTLLSHTSVENRGAVMGLNITFSSLGWLGATGLGGLVLGVAGFPGLAVMTCLFGLLGGALALVAWLGSRQAATESPRA